MAKVIFHIDLNAFFATCEQLRNPELFGKPIAVCTDSRGSVVTTASYEARAFGVHSALPLAIAKQKCPQLITVDADFSLYHKKSGEFMDFLKDYSTIIEPASIDEAYLDVTQLIKNYEKPLQLAIDIQQQLKQKTGLWCSIGVGPNKFLAKMASDRRKPDGIFVLRKREVESKLWPLDIGKMHGIGRVSSQKLREINIITIGDLANAALDRLVPVLKNQAYFFQQLAWGNDESVLETDHQVKSISASNSLYEPLFEYEEISQLLRTQAADIARKLNQDQFGALQLSLTVRNDVYQQYSKSITFKSPITDAQDMYQQALLLYDQFEVEGGLKYCGLFVNRFESIEDEIFTLFNQQQNISSQEIIQKVNDLFDGKVLKRGSEASNE